MPLKVSILIPVYNEEDLVPAVLSRVLAVSFGEDIETEIIAVDDGSTDSSADVLEEFAARHPGKIAVIRHDVNQGKGAAICTAIDHATGDFGVIQDSDLEYNPQDLPAVLRPLIEGRADAVYGSRFASAGERRVLYYWHSIANHWLTTLCNMVADLNLTDMETGYKAFRLSLVKSIPLRSKRFGMEPELTIKLAQRGASVYEVPISYHGRTYEEGKKIGFKDAIQALLIILNYGFRRDIYQDYGARILDALAQTPRFNAWMAETVRPYLGSHILEIGAGIGNISQYLSPRRKSYVASDIDEEHLSRLWVRFLNRPNLALIKCDLANPEDFVELKGRFDTVVCLNVLEHIEDDALGLRNVAGALAPGGTAIVLVPQGMAVYGTLDEVLGHYRRYYEKELVGKMQAAGFEVERVLHFNRITRPGWWFNGQILRRRYFSRFQLWLFDRLVWLWRRIDDKLPWQSVSIIAIARKR